MTWTRSFKALVQQRWGFLDPWWEALKSRISYCDSSLAPGEVWGSHGVVLLVNMPARRKNQFYGRTRYEATFRKEFQRVREALALLVAVEHADCEVYAYLLDKCWKIRPRNFCCEMQRGTTHVQLVLDVSKQEPQTGEGFIKYDLVRFCGIQSPSEAYVTALSQIAALDETKPTDIEIPVKVMYRKDDDESDTSSLDFAMALVDITHAEKEIHAQWETLRDRTANKDLEPGVLQCTFVLQPMDVGFEMLELTQTEAGTLKTLLDYGFRFFASRMVTSILRENPVHELDARKALGQLLRQLLCSARRKQDDAHIPYHFEQDLTDQGLQLILPGTMPASDFEATCSAMLQTQTTEKLLVATNHEHKWKWLAYALFSKQSRSSIQNLVICANLPTVADARAFTSILTSEHPEETLFGTPRGVAEGRDATLRSGAPIRWEFDSEGQPVLNSQLLTLEAPSPLVRTFSDDGESEWVNVMVPGFSRCQVQRSNLDFTSYDDADNSSSSITSLSISTNMADVDNLPRAEWLLSCIELIGFALTSLTLTAPRSAAIDENAIIRCCPKLLELSLATGSLDVQLDFSDYRATRTPIPHLTFAWHDATTFVNDLADPETPLSRCARRLRVDQNFKRLNNGARINWFENVRALLKMLSVNERLGYLEVRSMIPHFGKNFSKFHRKPIFQQRNPLPRKCMLAFLSVLPSRATSTAQAKKRNVAETAAAAGELDRHVVGYIFSFAASSALREVYYAYLSVKEVFREQQARGEQYLQEEQ